MNKWQKKIHQALKNSSFSSGISTDFILDKECFYVALASFIQNLDKNFIVITPDLLTSERIVEDLRNFQFLVNLPGEIHLLPEIESTKIRSAPENESSRYRVYDRAGIAESICFIASITSVLTTVPNPGLFRQWKFVLQKGDSNWPPEKLAAHLVEINYDNEVQVNQPGEFSWRGGILDVYSPVNDYPIRIDYWGNTIESIRFFDPESQRSVKEIEQGVIIPCGTLSKYSDCENEFNFLDYFSEESLLLIFCDIEAIENHLNRFGNDRELKSWKRILNQNHQKIFLREIGDGNASSLESPPKNSFYSLAHLSTSVLPDIEESTVAVHLQYLKEHLQRWSEEEYCFILCTSKQIVESRLSNMLGEGSLFFKQSMVIDDVHLSNGVIFPKQKIVLFSETDLLGKPKIDKKKSKNSHFRINQSFPSGLELVEGEFAVHAVHGIGRYIGLKVEQFPDRIQEVLILEFADEVKILVPLDQSYLISRYVGASKKLPKLSRVGTIAWRKAKNAAMEAVNDLASELIRVQAIRKCAKGFSFVGSSIDDMRRFVEHFPYDETEDQRSAIEHVLNDMEQHQPMDRLICGDVGYGKTEVAMRAACKAVLCGKQVAILVPTTVLAQQHYLTFIQRFSELPIIIESLSRFRNLGEQRKIIKGLAGGQIDIVIGTHRLLQSDVQFKDLGLIIIDEEQRFGVRHKEKLKSMRINLDILTLTATPIPRTLYMSMSGLKDMSTIMTAPLERLPIKTWVGPHEDALVKKAILHEIQRGGQVFYLHNRVKSIYGIQKKLQRLLPEISIDVAHGQMHEADLESAMIRFIEGQTSVLLCTTIIESGMDIPNANTMIIDRADQFGLAELYQLRGRIGRYDRQAYAYLFLPKTTMILNSAKQRLAAIQKYTQLGAGFKLALRDLEIRGAGNIIGAQQSGHISAIGFELYCQLMKEAVARLKNEQPPSRQEVNLDLDFLAFGRSSSRLLSAEIPMGFIEDVDQRLHCYRRLSEFVEISEVDEFSAELCDRFGILPSPLINLLKVTKLKIQAAKKGIRTISTKEKRVIIESESGLYQTPKKRLPRLTFQDPEKFLDELLNIIHNLDLSFVNKSLPSVNNKMAGHSRGYGRNINYKQSSFHTFNPCTKTP